MKLIGLLYNTLHTIQYRFCTIMYRFTGIYVAIKNHIIKDVEKLKKKKKKSILFENRLSDPQQIILISENYNRVAFPSHSNANQKF